MNGRCLLVEFSGPKALLEQEGHLQHAGLFIPAVDPMPEANDALELRIESPYGAAIAIAGHVVQVFAGMGFAVAPDDIEAARVALAPLFAAARTDDSGSSAAPRVAWQDGASGPADSQAEVGEAPSATESLAADGAGGESEASGTIFDRLRAMSVRERMILARKGSRAERLILMKDNNKTIHMFLLQNPRITLDEVRYMAGNRQCGIDALKMISENRIWTQNPGIVTALVRNPKTPTPIAIRLLGRLPKGELARIARSGGASRAVVDAAKRKVLSRN